MKLRLRFVSNSSSSSFIIAAKNKKKLDGAILEIVVDLNDYVKKTVTTLKELNALQKGEEYHFDDETFEKMVNEIKEGNTIFVGSFTDEDWDDPTEFYLCHEGLPPVKDIIQSDGGY